MKIAVIGTGVIGRLRARTIAGRGHAREAPKIGDQMRLVEVPALERESCPVGSLESACVHEIEDSTEPTNACKAFWGEPDRGCKESVEPLSAHAHARLNALQALATIE